MAYDDYAEMDDIYAEDSRTVWREPTDAEVKKMTERLLSRLTLESGLKQVVRLLEARAMFLER